MISEKIREKLVFLNNLVYLNDSENITTPSAKLRLRERFKILNPSPETPLKLPIQFSFVGDLGRSQGTFWPTFWALRSRSNAVRCLIFIWSSQEYQILWQHELFPQLLENQSALLGIQVNNQRKMINDLNSSYSPSYTYRGIDYSKI